MAGAGSGGGVPEQGAEEERCIRCDGDSVKKLHECKKDPPHCMRCRGGMVDCDSGLTAAPHS